MTGVRIGSTIVMKDSARATRCAIVSALLLLLFADSGERMLELRGAATVIVAVAVQHVGVHFEV